MSVVLEEIISIAVHVTLCVTSSLASHIEVKEEQMGVFWMFPISSFRIDWFDLLATQGTFKRNVITK